MSDWRPTIQQTLLLLVIASLTTAVVAQTRFSSPDETVDQVFWGKLYAKGGTTFFCNESFGTSRFLLTEGYIYPLNHARNALRCGTQRQCVQNSQTYRHLASDLHNMIPVKSRIEMQRRNASYDDFGQTGQEEDCGIKKAIQTIEPPDRVKGDVARGVAYVMDTYGLPAPGSAKVFKQWHQQDPAGDSELTRNRRIKELQGNENRFISNPDALFGDELWHGKAGLEG